MRPFFAHTVGEAVSPTDPSMIVPPENGDPPLESNALDKDPDPVVANVIRRSIVL